MSADNALVWFSKEPASCGRICCTVVLGRSMDNHTKIYNIYVHIQSMHKKLKNYYTINY